MNGGRGSMRSRIIVISRDAVSRGRLARMLMNGGYRAEVAESIARARRAGLKGIALAIIESDEGWWERQLPETRPSRQQRS